MNRKKILATAISIFFMLQIVAIVWRPLGIDNTSYGETESTRPYESPTLPTMAEKMINYSVTKNAYPSNWSFIKYLKDNPNEYSKVWEPWITKAAIHAVVTNENGTMIAFGGGYLYDNEIHIYRWNYETQQYEKVWDSGDGIISGDVVSLAFGDTDNNKLMEIIAGSADGHIYVFEQRHIYDPVTNTENMFDLVWKSEFLGPVWKVAVYDIDLDYDPDIIAGTWTNKIYVFEYKNHSGYPFSRQHWIDYRKVWESPDLGDKVYALACGDLNGNGLPDFIVGLRNGEIIIFENNGTVIPLDGSTIALPQDNNYKVIWQYSYGTYSPILDIAVGDTDGDGIDEASIIESGKEAYILDYNPVWDMFRLIKLYYPPKSYELEYPHPVDYWIDWMVEGVNIYFYNGTTWFTEPIPKENATPSTGIGFNNTAMGGHYDGKYSQFLPNSTHNATAILDFGSQEEAVGGGTPGYDFYIMFYRVSGFDDTPNRSAIRFYVSKDGSRYVELTDYVSAFSSTYTYTYFDIDPILKENNWRHIRYLKIVVNHGYKFAIDAIRTYYIDKQVSDVSSTYITSIDLGYGDRNYVLYGTVTGKLIIFQYNESIDGYELVYDSEAEDDYSIGENIWDILKIKPDERFPYWVHIAGYGIDLGTYSVENMDLFDMDRDGDEDLIIGTVQGDILYYQYTSEGFVRDTYSENILFGNINEQPTFFMSVRMCNIIDSPSAPGPELVAAYWNLTTSSMEISIFYLESPFHISYNASRRYSVGSHEVTEKLMGMLNGPVYTPLTLDVGDMDGDGLDDIVLAASGELYLIRNLGGEPPQFALDDEYFDGIAEQLGGKTLYEPQIVDFNRDGIPDIVVSYYSKNGSTYFENIGTRDEPIWVQKKQLFANSVSSTNPVTNFAFNGFTLSQVVYDEDTDKYYLWAKKRGVGEIHLFEGRTDGISTLALATYPLLTVINIAPLVPTATEKNFGYHIFEVWSNHRDLHGWTQAIAHGDVDGDGKGEIIVGDFDNNVYIFEHLTNNTYKRAFRSNDLYYEIVTNKSPYYAGELGGLEATFKRRIWEHARYLVADADIDHDNRKEVIVATKYQIYVFEHQKYENYGLEYRYSFLDHPLATVLMEYTDGISAFAYCYDLDYNGYGEVIVAIDGALFVLELTEDGFIETFNYLAGLFREKFEKFLSTYEYNELEPIFMTPGSPYTYYYNTISAFKKYFSQLKIRAIVVADLDENGNKEIIIGGVNETLSCRSLHGGFLYAIETQFGTYYTKWAAPFNITYKNPINTLRIDDQDYDGKMELIVGGEKGIDIFETSGSDYLKYITTISASPDHPYVNNTGVFTIIWAGYASSQLPDQDIVILPSGRIVLFFISKYSLYGKETELYFAYSDDGGKTWSTPEVLSTPTDYGSVTPVAERYPRVLYYYGRIYVAWYAEVNVSTPTNNYTICFRYINVSDFTDRSPIEMVINSTNNFTRSISLWRYYLWTGFGYYDFGISYINTSDYDLYIYVRYYSYFLGARWYKHPNSPRIYHIYDNTWSGFYDHDIAYVGDNTWLMAFVCSKSLNGRRPIWTSITNNTFTNWTEPQAVYPTLYYEYYPSVEYYDKEDIVVVGGMIYNTFHPLIPFVVSSRNKGASWSSPRIIYRYHPSIREVCINGTVAYVYGTNPRTTYYVRDHNTFGLRLSINDNGEVVFSFGVDFTYWIGSKRNVVHDIVVGYRESHDWLIFELGDTRVLAVGDTDGDGRREIISNYYEDGVTVFEISDNYLAYRRYTQVAIMEKLNNTVTCISVGDSNGNGWDELVVSMDYGNVYSFEFIHAGSWTPTNISVPRLEFKYKYFTYADAIKEYDIADIDGDGYMEYYCRDNYFLYTIDTAYSMPDYLYFSSGIAYVRAYTPPGEPADFIVALNNGTIAYVDGRTLSVIDMLVAFGGSVEDIEFGYDTLFVTNYSGYVVEVDPVSMGVLWEYNLDTSGVVDLGIVREGGHILGVILRLMNGTAYCVDYSSKTIIWSADLSYGSIWRMLSYDFNGDGVDEIVVQNYSDSKYIIMVLSGSNGRVLYTVEYESDYTFREFRLLNVDNDSFIDILAVAYRGEVAISSRSFDVIWYSVDYKKDNYYIWDFDGDGMSEILTSFDGGAILSNSYGMMRMYYGWPRNSTYMVMGDVDADGESEIMGFLSTGHFVVVGESAFEETYRGLAYYRPKIAGEYKLLGNISRGIVQTFDTDLDGYEEIFVSNGTDIVGYSFRDNRVFMSISLDTNIREILYGDLLGKGSNSTIVVYDDYNVTAIDLSGNIIFSVRVVSPPYYIIRAFVGDFTGSGNSVMVVAANGIYIIKSSGVPYLFSTLEVPTYPIVGDFDGDGILQLAYKRYDNGLLVVYNEDGSVAWSTALNGTEINNYTWDIFAIDYNGDGVDDIGYTDAHGKIVIYNGSNGAILDVISTGIESFGLWMGMDKTFGGAIAVKYAGYGLYIYDSLGNVLYEFRDESTNGYWSMEIGGYPYYVSWTPSKIYGTNASNKHIYLPLEEEIYDVASLRCGGEKLLVALAQDGRIVIISLVIGEPAEIPTTKTLGIQQAPSHNIMLHVNSTDRLCLVIKRE